MCGEEQTHRERCRSWRTKSTGSNRGFVTHGSYSETRHLSRISELRTFFTIVRVCVWIPTEFHEFMCVINDVPLLIALSLSLSLSSYVDPLYLLQYRTSELYAGVFIVHLCVCVRVSWCLCLYSFIHPFGSSSFLSKFRLCRRLPCFTLWFAVRDKRNAQPFL